MAQLENESSKDLEIMKNLIITNLEALMEINPENIREIVQRFLENKETEIVKLLGKCPELQLKYIENILKDREDGKKVEDKELLLLHISLLC